MLLVKAPSSTESSVKEEFSESDDKDSSDGSLFLPFFLILCLVGFCAAEVNGA